MAEFCLKHLTTIKVLRIIELFLTLHEAGASLDVDTF